MTRTKISAEKRAALKQQRDREVIALATANGGHVTKEQVVDFGQANPESAIAQALEWDDTEAAHRYRLIQASEIIRSVTIEERENHIRMAVPMFVRDPNKDSPESGYMALQKVRHSEDLSRDVAINELRQTRGVVQRARKVLKYLGEEETLMEIERLIDVLCKPRNPGDDPPQPTVQ